jgi:amino acid adenylation domain-containing protein
MSILPEFFHHARLTPDRQALSFHDRTWTYGEVLARVEAIMALLEQGAWTSERRVAILATQDVYTYAGILAVLASGRAYVPLHPHNPPERMWSCVQQAETRVLLQSGAESEMASWLGAEHPEIAVIDTTVDPRGTVLREPVPAQPADLAYILFTSGSTGLPKGVPIYHRNLSAFFEALLGQVGFDFGPEDRFLQMFDLTFDLSIMAAFTPLILGATAYIPPEKGVGYFNVQRLLEKERITVALMVPSVLSFLERYLDQIQLPHLRRSLFCGEALPASLAEKWLRCAPNARLFNVYGPTEATIFCTAYELPRTTNVQSHHGVVSIGRPMAGTRLLVLGENGALVDEGDTGELCLAGAQVTDKYWNNAERTGQAFVDLAIGSQVLRSYRTGDLAFERDGEFFFCGRSDHQVKIAGYRVELGEIEFHARNLPGVTNAAAVAERDAAGSYTLHLFLQVADATDAGAPARHRTELAKHLPVYMIPKKINLLSALPLNQNGKIDRPRLAQQVKEAGQTK